MASKLVASAAAGLTNPATVLVERVSDAVGGIARPWQIERVAEAEAKAEARKALILAESEIEITDLQRRAALRWMQEETKNQENVERITHQALSHLNDEAEPETIEDDFLRNFFDKCRIVSDDQMQGVWARILAGEANNPGTFSRKTINILADMDRGDATAFANLCRFIWQFPEDLVPPMFDHDSFYDDSGLPYHTLAELESLGLIHMQDNLRIGPLPNVFEVSYFGRRIELTIDPSSADSIAIGDTVLTAAGSQISSICDVQPVDGFFDFARDKWETDPYIESVKVLDEQVD